MIRRFYGKMKFKEAFSLMRKGLKVKLPSWEGFWCWNELKQTIEMHCNPNIAESLDIRSTDDLAFTLGNICAEEWILYDIDSSLEELHPKFNFSEALILLNHGFFLTRESWADTNKLLTLIPPNSAVSKGTLLLRNSGAWIPSQDDILSDDWLVVL